MVIPNMTPIISSTLDIYQTSNCRGWVLSRHLDLFSLRSFELELNQKDDSMNLCLCIVLDVKGRCSEWFKDLIVLCYLFYLMLIISRF